MKMLYVSFVLLLCTISFPQSNEPVYLTGSLDDISMNASFSPDGQKIAFTKSGYQGIWVYDLTTNSTKQITDELAAGYAYKWSSDSKSILSRVAKYESQNRYNAVKVFDIQNDQSLQLTDYRVRMPYLPEWSDGDTKVILPSKTGFEVFNSGKQNNGILLKREVNAFVFNDKILTRDVNTESSKTIDPIKNSQVLNLVTSPDKSKVAFEIIGGDMYSMNIDGTGLTDLGKGYRPKWSADSKKIIYMITEDNGDVFTASDIYSINADGSQKKNLTNTPDKIEMNPCFSPDGKKIVFDDYNDGSIYIMNIQ